MGSNKFSSSTTATNGLGLSLANGERHVSPSSTFLAKAYEGGFKDPTKKPVRPRSSARLNADDSVAIHLLVETIIGGRPDFEVLSIEEVDELKKESSRVIYQIEVTERKLMLETKVRDAARSLSRLSSREDKGRDLETSSASRRQNSFNDQREYDSFLIGTNDALAESTKKCEDLAQVLWNLEKRLTKLQKRLLEHTTGVLHLSHRAALKEPAKRGQVTTQGSDFKDFSGFHELSLERGVPHHNASSVSSSDGYFGVSQQSQAVRSESSTKVRNVDLERSWQAIRRTEQRLEDLNARLKNIVVAAKPKKGSFLHELPSSQAGASTADPGEQIQAQLEYLSNGLEIIQSQRDEHIKSQEKTKDAIDQKLRNLYSRFHALTAELNLANDDYRPSSDETGLGTVEQLAYLERGLEALASELKSNARNPAHQEKAEQYETVLTGLWEILMSGEAEARQQVRQSLRSSPDRNGGVTPDGGEAPTTEKFSLQAFSTKIQWLYGRVSGLEVEKNILRRQIQQQRELSHESDSVKDTVVTQLTEELERTKAELEMTRREANNAKQEMAALVQRLDSAKKELTLREQQRADDDSISMNEMAQKQEEICRLEALIQGAQENQDMIRTETQNQISEREQRIQALEADLRASAQEKERLDASEAVLKQHIAQITRQLETAQAEQKKVENEVIRLQTEATFARAELEGAYGTRAQRAAEVVPDAELQKQMDELARRNMSLLEEVAALKQEKPSEEGPSARVLQQEMDELVRRNMSLLEEIAVLKRTAPSSESGGSNNTQKLQQRIEVLQKELSETIDEYEAMTKQSVAFEKEREQLENMIDGLRERCESIEGQLHDEQVKWAGSQASSTAGREDGPVEPPSVRTLRAEFRKIMKETRAENFKALKIEQDERRRLEALVRSLKKDQAQAATTSTTTTAKRTGS